MRVTHANLLLRSSPAHYRTYQRDPKVHQPGWPAGRTSRPRARRRRRATGRVTGDRGAGDADTPILPPPPPAMPPVVVVVPSVPSVPTRVAVVVGGGASSATAGTRGATDEQDEERNAERPATRRDRRGGRCCSETHVRISIVPAAPGYKSPPGTGSADATHPVGSGPAPGRRHSADPAPPSPTQKTLPTARSAARLISGVGYPRATLGRRGARSAGRTV